MNRLRDRAHSSAARISQVTACGSEQSHPAIHWPHCPLSLKGTAAVSQRYSDRERSGFSALPGGNRNNNGNFNNVGNNAYFWSSSPNGSNAWNRKLNSGNDNVNRNNNNQRNGFSVRCVRDDSGDRACPAGQALTLAR